MKTLHFLCAFTLLFLTSTVIKPDAHITNTEQDRKAYEKNGQTEKQIPQYVYKVTEFQDIDLWINDLEHRMIEETDMPKNCKFFEDQLDEIIELQAKLEDANHIAIENIEKEKAYLDLQYEARINQAAKDNIEEINKAHKTYNNLHAAHSSHLQNLTIDEQAEAVEQFKLTTVNALHAKVKVLQEEHTAKLEQLAIEHAHELQCLELKKEAINQKYHETIDRYRAMISTFDQEEEKALINAQIEHMQQLKEREFDETFTTAKHPTVWSGLGSVVGASPYSYRANEHALECSGCIEIPNFSINSRLKKEMEATQSTHAAESLAMVLRALKKAHAENGHEYILGVQSCRLDGNRLHCRTLPMVYNEALKNRTSAPENQHGHNKVQDAEKNE